MIKLFVILKSLFTVENTSHCGLNFYCIMPFDCTLSSQPFVMVLVTDFYHLNKYFSFITGCECFISAYTGVHFMKYWK